MTKKKLLTILLVTVILLAVIDIAVGFGISLYIRNFSLPGDYGKIEYMLKQVNSPIILLGASTCACAIDSEILEKGLEKKVFNGGLNDQRLEFFDVMSEAILKRSPAPELLILVLRANDLTTSQKGRLAIMNIYYRNGNAKLDRYLDGGELKQRILLSSVLYRINTFWWRILLYHFKSFNELSHGGFIGKPVPKFLPTSMVLAEEKTVPEVNRHKLQCLKNIHAACRKNGTKLLIMITPEYFQCSPGFERRGETVIRQFCAEYNIPLINDSHNPDYISHPEFFFDNHHLNINGAKVYSEHILQLLRKDFAK